jgi:hypothetical protein
MKLGLSQTKEEHRLRAPEKRALRRILGSKREKMTGGWRRLHNEELHNFDASPDITIVLKLRSMRRAGHVAGAGEMRRIQYFGRKT